MSLTVALDGKPIATSEMQIHADYIGGATGTFSLDPSVPIRPGDTISITYENNLLASGVIASTVRHTNGSPTSATFISGTTRVYGVPSTTIQHHWISAKDQAILDNFLIDSFARGFAKGG